MEDVKKMQLSILVGLLAALVCTGSVDAHVEKLFGIINRLMNEREASRTSWFLGGFSLKLLKSISPFSLGN